MATSHHQPAGYLLPWEVPSLESAWKLPPGRSKLQKWSRGPSTPGLEQQCHNGEEMGRKSQGFFMPKQWLDFLFGLFFWGLFRFFESCLRKMKKLGSKTFGAEGQRSSAAYFSKAAPEKKDTDWLMFKRNLGPQIMPSPFSTHFPRKP